MSFHDRVCDRFALFLCPFARASTSYRIKSRHPPIIEPGRNNQTPTVPNTTHFELIKRRESLAEGSGRSRIVNAAQDYDFL